MPVDELVAKVPSKPDASRKGLFRLGEYLRAESPGTLLLPFITYLYNQLWIIEVREALTDEITLSELYSSSTIDAPSVLQTLKFGPSPLLLFTILESWVVVHDLLQSVTKGKAIQ